MSAVAQQNLPNMGEPADTALSPIEERQLGAQFMRQIRASMPVVRDVQSNEYIQTLGRRLALASGKAHTMDFNFFVINDDQINAFAIPGGYVGVNIGLIQAMQTEEQLAGVVAHEVAHVTQRHHARAFALGNQYSMRTAATILAAILIGQASAEAGQAALAAGMAATQQSAINFTRGNETEADRIGIEILANARYNPGAMAESFAILRRKNSLNTSRNALQYLRTHPLDNNRIAEARDRSDSKSAIPLNPQTDFQIFKARLDVLSSTDRGELLRAYMAKHQKNPNVGNTYGIALLHLEANRLDKAGSYLDKLDNLAPRNPNAKLLRAIVLEKQGNLTESLNKLNALYDFYPERYSVVEKLLDLHNRERRYTKASNIAKTYLREIPNPNPLAWRQLAGFQQRLGDKAASHESLSRYFAGLSEISRAVSQLKLALQHVTPNSNDELRLNASLKFYTERPPTQ
jgi:predicted Zn-dependent protease